MCVCVCVYVLVTSHVRLFVTPWTVAYQAPFSVHGNLQAKILEWLAISFSRESSQSRDWTWVFCIIGRFFIVSVQFSSVAQLCPILSDSMDCSTPGLPVHHWLPELTQIHVHWVGEVFPIPLSLQFFPSSGSIQMSQFFTSGGQSTGVSASVSVLPMNIQDWFTLGWTGWISLQSKGLSRVFFNTAVQKHQFFSAQLPLLSNSHIHSWSLEKP